MSVAAYSVDQEIFQLCCDGIVMGLWCCEMLRSFLEQLERAVVQSCGGKWTMTFFFFLNYLNSEVIVIDKESSHCVELNSAYDMAVMKSRK